MGVLVQAIKLDVFFLHNATTEDRKLKHHSNPCKWVVPTFHNFAELFFDLSKRITVKEILSTSNDTTSVSSN